MHRVSLVPGGTVVGTLKGEKLMNGLHRHWIGRPNAHLRAARSIGRCIAQGRRTRGHDSGAWNVTRVHQTRVGEIAPRELGGNLSHVRSDRRDTSCIARRVTIEYDAASIGQILEDVRRCVLIDPHDAPSARLHRREDAVRRTRRVARPRGRLARAGYRCGREADEESRTSPCGVVTQFHDSFPDPVVDRGAVRGAP